MNIIRSIRKETKTIDRLLKKLPSASKPSVWQIIKKRFLFILFAGLLLCLIIPPYIYPVKGRITSGYGLRRNTFSTIPALEFHPALDIAAPLGTTLRAAKSGFVARAGTMYGYGNFVEVKHWFGFSTLYGHMHKISVVKGQPIIKGWKIGTVGNTGLSRSPHVHFEVRFFGKKLPPGFFLFFDTVQNRILSLFFK